MKANAKKMTAFYHPGEHNKLYIADLQAFQDKYEMVSQFKASSEESNTEE